MQPLLHLPFLSMRVLLTVLPLSSLYPSHSTLFPCCLPESPTFPHFQPCESRVKANTSMGLTKRCPHLPSGEVVLERRASHPLPSGDHCVNMVFQISASFPASGPEPLAATEHNSADRWTQSGTVPTASLCQLYWRNNMDTGVSMPASCHQINTVWYALIVGWLVSQSVGSG